MRPWNRCGQHAEVSLLLAQEGREEIPAKGEFVESGHPGSWRRRGFGHLTTVHTQAVQRTQVTFKTGSSRHGKPKPWEADKCVVKVSVIQWLCSIHLSTGPGQLGREVDCRMVLPSNNCKESLNPCCCRN